MCERKVLCGDHALREVLSHCLPRVLGDIDNTQMDWRRVSKVNPKTTCKTPNLFRTSIPLSLLHITLQACHRKIKKGRWIGKERGKQGIRTRTRIGLTAKRTRKDRMIKIKEEMPTRENR
jgi:predicted DNA-binding protein (UPF0278 family)